MGVPWCGPAWKWWNKRKVRVTERSHFDDFFSVENEDFFG